MPEERAMPTEVTRADIDRLHARLDGMAVTQTEQAVLLGRIDERLQRLPPPPVIPARPCEHFERHLEEHDEQEAAQRATVKDVVMKLLTPALSAAGGAIAAVIGLGHQK